MTVGILEPRDFSVKAKAELESIGEVRLKGQESIEQFLEPIEVLFVRLGTYIGKSLIGHAPMLKYLCSPTTGANHVDLKALHQRGIRYVSLKGEGAFLADIRATPEHTFGLVLSLLRNYKAMYSNIQVAWDRDTYRGNEIYGNRVGIIGMGRVGSQLTKYFRAFDAIVGYVDIKAVTPPYDDLKCFDNLEDLINHSDIIILCASYEEGQSPILKANHLKQLAGKYLINTSRGELIEEDVLFQLACKGYFSGLALDVLAGETLPQNRISLWADLASKEPNLILTPHVAGATLSSMQRTELFITQKLTKILRETH